MPMPRPRFVVTRPRRRFAHEERTAREALLLDLLAAQMGVSGTLLTESEAEERRLRADLATLQARLLELVAEEVAPA